MLLDLFLVACLGFLGSFGHCAGMCAPIAIAFSLSQNRSSWHFHFLLNCGRIISYTLVGAIIGGFGSLLISGIGSPFRQGMSVFTGLILIWLGISQIQPFALPQLPIFHPLLNAKLHDRWQKLMIQISQRLFWWTPLALGTIWGLIPCGFLYTAQIKAAETGNAWQGAATMCCFGLGTMPTLVLLAIFSNRLSRDRQSQLFQLGGWITLTIGILTIFRTDAHTDFTGHGALICLSLAAIARPLAILWSGLLRFRRALGVGGFMLSFAHLLHMVDMSLQWNLSALSFLIPQHQLGINLGIIAFLLLIPLAATSFNWWQKQLGKGWRSLHLISIPILLLAIGHTILIGSHYLGGFEDSIWHWLRSGMLIVLCLGVLLIRWRGTWKMLALEEFYVKN
jgi:uncharacterized protein